MQAATLTAVVVLPTPPFWFAIAYTVDIVDPTLARAAADSAPNGPCARTWCGFALILLQTGAVSWPCRAAGESAGAWAQPCGRRAVCGRGHARRARPGGLRR